MDWENCLRALLGKTDLKWTLAWLFLSLSFIFTQASYGLLGVAVLFVFGSLYVEGLVWYVCVCLYYIWKENMDCDYFLVWFWISMKNIYIDEWVVLSGHAKNWNITIFSDTMKKININFAWQYM